MTKYHIDRGFLIIDVSDNHVAIFDLDTIIRTFKDDYSRKVACDVAEYIYRDLLSRPPIGTSRTDFIGTAQEITDVVVRYVVKNRERYWRSCCFGFGVE